MEVVMITSRYDPYNPMAESISKLINCKGGGGSSSGAVSYPAYMEAKHTTWLDEMAVLITTAVTGASPFASETAYDPASRITTMEGAVTTFKAAVDALDHDADWEAGIDTAKTKLDAEVFNDTYINADIAAFQDLLEDDIADVILPQFQTGMRDINAVYSSAFIMGEADIYAKKTKEVTKYGTDLRMKLNLQRNEAIIKCTNNMLENLIKQVTLNQAISAQTIENGRIGIVAFKEQADQDFNIIDLDARWDLDVYQYGANMLGGISGGTVKAGGDAGMSKGQSAIGGALAGAAAGAYVGSVVPGLSTAVGAGIGALLGAAGGFL